MASIYSAAGINYVEYNEWRASSTLPRRPGNVLSGATREARGGNFRNGTIHLYTSNGWSEISGELRQNTAAFKALHERGELRKRFKINADKQKQAKAAARAIKATTQASYGRFAQAHSSGLRHLEGLANTNEKIKRVQGKVKKVEEKTRELAAKLNKAF